MALIITRGYKDPWDYPKTIEELKELIKARKADGQEWLCDLREIDPPMEVLNRYLFRECTSLVDVIIPDSVTEIGESAFWNCTGLTSVVIPDSVTNIEEHAFAFCSKLDEINIPINVTSIKQGAFFGCTGLTSIKVAEGNKVYDSRDKCNAIIKTATKCLIVGCSSTVIPNGVTCIGQGAFRACGNLTSIDIPNSVKKICQFAFDRSGLTSIVLSNQLTEIGPEAFIGCRFTEINIPAKVGKIHPTAFNGCSNLATITVDEGNVVYDSRDNCNAIIKTATNCLIAGCGSAIIPNSVTEISAYAFSYCGSLTSINIPDSVTKIGSSAFYNCDSLMSVNLPGSVKDLGNRIFNNCSGLSDVNIQHGITKIKQTMFFKCTNLTSVTIPNSVKTIEYSAFAYCI